MNIRYVGLVVGGMFASLLLAREASPQQPGEGAMVITEPLDPLAVLASIRGVLAGPSAGSSVPARFSTVTAADLRAYSPVLLGDALQSRGLASQYDDLGSPLKQTIMMRGFAASPVVGLPQGITVFVDGIPMNEPGAGEVMLDLLPAEFAQSVEIFRGSSALLGPNSLGGAINLVTHGGARGGDIEIQAGSNAQYGGHAVVRSGWSNTTLTTGILHDQMKGWRAEMRSERTAFLGTFGWRGNHGAGVRLLAFGGRSHAQTAGSLPLSVLTANPDSNLTAGDFEALRQITIAASGFKQLANGLVSARLYARVGDAERFNVNQELDPDVRSFSESRTAGIDADWSSTWNHADGALALRIGGGLLANRSTIQLHRERIDPGLTTDVASPIRRADLYGAARLDRGRAAFTAALRADFVRMPYQNLLDSERDTINHFFQLNPRAGVSVRVAEKGEGYASVGKSFRPPAVIELACADPEEPCPLPFALGDDPPLDPVRVTTWEGGYRWTAETSQLSIGGYVANVRGDIFMFPYEEDGEPQGSTIDGYFGNIDKTCRAGVEISAATQLHGVQLRLEYQYQRATFGVDDVELFSIREHDGAENVVNNGHRFPLVPDHVLNFGVDRDFGGVQAGVQVNYVGERYLRGDEANEEAPLDDHTTMDLRIAAAMRGWEVRAVLLNALAANYHAFGTFNINQAAGQVERFVTPGRPRSLEVSLRYAF